MKSIVLFAPFFGTLGTLSCVSRNPAVPNINESSHLVERCHRFISTSNLKLVPICFIVAAFLVRALHCVNVRPRVLCRDCSKYKYTSGLVHIIPSAFSTKNIFDLLPFYGPAFEVSFVDNELIGTSIAFEAIVADLLLYGWVSRWHLTYPEDIAAGWTDWKRSVVYTWRIEHSLTEKHFWCNDATRRTYDRPGFVCERNCQPLNGVGNFLEWAVED